jgi:hypothetical protein
MYNMNHYGYGYGYGGAIRRKKKDSKCKIYEPKNPKYWLTPEGKCISYATHIKNYREKGKVSNEMNPWLKFLEQFRKKNKKKLEGLPQSEVVKLAKKPYQQLKKGKTTIKKTTKKKTTRKKLLPTSGPISEIIPFGIPPKKSYPEGRYSVSYAEERYPSHPPPSYESLYPSLPPPNYKSLYKKDPSFLPPSYESLYPPPSYESLYPSYKPEYTVESASEEEEEYLKPYPKNKNYPEITEIKGYPEIEYYPRLHPEITEISEYEDLVPEIDRIMNEYPIEENFPGEFREEFPSLPEIPRHTKQKRRKAKSLKEKLKGAPVFYESEKTEYPSKGLVYMTDLGKIKERPILGRAGRRHKTIGQKKKK